MSTSRRSFLIGSTALVLAGPALAVPGFADYQEGLIRDLLKQGRTVFVDYAADWCGTCAKQERVIQALMQENPDYGKHIAFVRVDWDDYKTADVTTSRQIPRRSTLIVLKGNEELGRIVAGTAKDEIKALLDAALSAAIAS